MVFQFDYTFSGSLRIASHRHALFSFRFGGVCDGVPIKRVVVCIRLPSSRELFGSVDGGGVVVMALWRDLFVRARCAAAYFFGPCRRMENGAPAYPNVHLCDMCSMHVDTHAVCVCRIC